MELRHIRYFLAVAEEGNFTRAARRIGIGQPPLSQQIRDLEDEVGVALFRRVPHGAELTDAGRAFLASVRHIPEQAGAATVAAQRAARGETGSVRIGFTGSAAFNHRVPASIRTFRRQHPDVVLALEEANSNLLATALREGRLDAVFLRPEAIDRSDLDIHVLEKEPLIAALASSRMPNEDGIQLASLAEDLFIVTPKPLGPTIFDATIQACRNAGFEPKLGQSAPQIASVIALVAAEMGVALVPAAMSEVTVKGVNYHAIVDDLPSVELAIAVRRGERSAAVLAFLKQARSVN
ncbi:LysR family transcriptional regulator [Novosphingobium sp. 9]|uniref:LysR family transcriptional regulator n=1 Tax=Novosphingobium sp. 9 TaxID=2025349 RepID=UPI0021B553DA|nr:LysR family transcriptional regulator [Novosphingobium sp. 9]